MGEFCFVMFSIVFLFFVLDSDEKIKVKIKTKEYLKEQRKKRRK